jgi:D-serine deaminase-like pyridoxal phosphate-dependent protein
VTALPRSIEELETPAVLIDLDVVQRNVETMAARAREAGLSLRPHAKTHKAPVIGRMQLEAGARGLSLAKTSEAEVFADAGFSDIFIAYPVVGLGKARRLVHLAERIRLAVGVDSVDGAASLGSEFAAASRRLDVMLKIDSGTHRVGVEPRAARDVARRIADLPGIRLRGVFTHAGHGYLQDTPEGVAAIGRHEGQTMAQVAAELRGAGLAIEEVSVGSTPTARHAMVPGVTECRPGNYVYHDASQVALGSCRLEDCAMTILATVVSTPAPDRAVLDAGSKTLSTDPLRPKGDGHGWVLRTRSRVSRVSEEHGVVAVAPGDSFHVGQRVRVLPNHACVVSNLHDRLVAVRGERVEGEIEVAARGRVL